ncbi:uromodulin-like [Rhinoderma darwinii]|uniref:uromodulin-like n=1 Tax=Rhinoderma darwinii TaxID=43563 RepID=UPI003F66AABB
MEVMFDPLMKPECPSCVSPECSVLCFSRIMSCLSPECPVLCSSRMLHLVFLQNVLSFVSLECVPSYNVRLVFLQNVLSCVSPECPSCVSPECSVLCFSPISRLMFVSPECSVLCFSMMCPILCLSCVSPECPNVLSCVSPECVPSYVCFSRHGYDSSVPIHLVAGRPLPLCPAPLFYFTYAKSCSFCNTTNSNCEARVGYVICTCKPGFIGNGLSCTRIVFCDTYKCCPDGYTWDAKNKQCADINECLTPTLNKCSPRETCINRNGIYLCVPNTSALCSGTACSSNQDCLKINDSFQCADPCDYYDLLNGDNKLSSIESTGRFITDRYNFGWFRYVGRITASLKVGAVGTFKCGSLEPFSLGGDHPDIGDGIKSVPIISNLLTGSVRAGSIPVKACARGYYVYKYSGMLKYDVYCTENGTFELNDVFLADMNKYLGNGNTDYHQKD